ncbi:MAG: FtsQ-type POTRA domain-containing protein [Acidobacteriota bacterium]
MATRKRTTRRKTGTTATRRKRTVSSRGQNSGAAAKFIVPFVFTVGILFCLGFLLFMGYRTVTASSFFDVKKIDVRGINRVSENDIEKIVSRQTEKSGVWNADLATIKEDIEKITQVKSAIVSRILPDGLRVNLIERQPRAVVRLDRGDLWADDDAVLFDLVEKNETRPPFVLKGWDESRTDKAAKNNQERVKIYLKMLDEWQEFELAKRVSAVNLSDLQAPQVTVQDSGETVTLELSKDNFAKRLQKSLEIIAGRGKEIESVSLNGQKEVLGFRIK